MVEWQYYPKSNKVPEKLRLIVDVFEKHECSIGSPQHKLSSDRVLYQIREDLEKIGFQVERGKRAEDRIRVPVLFGLRGNPTKSFDVDAYHEESGTVLEVEAGRAVMNYQFLRDLFEACMMPSVNYVAIAVRIKYRGRNDFKEVLKHFDTLYASRRLTLPLKGILTVGY